MLWWSGSMCCQTGRLQHVAPCVQVVQHEKARAVLMGQWGFGAKGELTGTTCLFHGPPGAPLACWHVSMAVRRSGAARARPHCCGPSCGLDAGGGALRVAGTGKTLAAEAVGFETGKPLKVPSAPDAEAVAVVVCQITSGARSTVSMRSCDSSPALSGRRKRGAGAQVVNCSGIVSKYVGDTGKSIDALFQEARAMDAVLVFDEVPNPPILHPSCSPDRRDDDCVPQALLQREAHIKRCIEPPTARDAPRQHARLPRRVVYFWLR